MNRGGVLKADFVVIGAGSAGCALAYRLSAEPSVSVALLEAGGSDAGLFFAMPAGAAALINNLKYEWAEHSEPDPTRAGQIDRWYRGKVLGGTSALNGMIYVRGQRQDYDRWAQQGGAGWSYNEVLPYFRRAERNSRGADRFHGGDGPVAVSDLRTLHPTTHLFVEAAVAAGIPRNPDLNGVDQEGVAPVQATQDRGCRASASRTYLKLARGRSNLTVITGAIARRVIIEGGHATSVEYERHGRKRTIFCAREVIVSASTIGSAKLLLLSGIGPAEELRNVGVKPVIDLPGVGKNLQEHVAPLLVWSVKTPTYNRLRNPLFVVGNITRWLLRKDGPLSSAASQAIAFVKTRSSLESPDVQMHFSPIGISKEGGKITILAEYSVSASPNVCRPTGRGEVRLRSANPEDPPVIEPRLLEEADLTILIESCRILRRIFATEPMASTVKAELSPGLGVRTNTQWADYIRAHSFPHYHPAGTCKMGRDQMAVVDERLRVRGVAGLRVADCSIMPTLVSANTNPAAIMIGEKASAMVLADANELTA